MLPLDFLTLYILVFLNSLTMSVVWAGFAYTYRPHKAAQHWLVATLLTLAGGIVLATQGNEGAIVPAVLGNTIIIFGFTQFWVGLRRFHNQPGGLSWSTGFTLVAAGLMIAMYDSERGRAIVYAVGQSLVMLTCLIHLMRNLMPGTGTIIAILAFAVALAGQLLIIASNAFVLAGALDFEIYYALASYALTCTVFSGGVWNLGFALMSVDSLQRRLKGLLETDELTGLANRRAFEGRLDELRVQSNTGTYCLVLIDLNDFKSLNDRFGHLAGDEALKHFANLLRECARSGDLIARFGGDEFALLLAGANLAHAEAFAEVVRKRVASSPLTLPDGSVTLSASIGVAGAGEKQADSNAHLFSIADRRLYEDKTTSKQRRTRSRQPGLHLVTGLRRRSD